MTSCLGVKLEEGLILVSDSHTHAGVDNCAKFCTMTAFERVGDRVLVLLSSGGLAATQAVISMLRLRADAKPPHVYTVPAMFRRGEPGGRRDARPRAPRQDASQERGLSFNASFILGGQIAGKEVQLFRIYAAGNFIEAGTDTSFLQTGEAKYGKPDPRPGGDAQRHAGGRHEMRAGVVRFDDARRPVGRHADPSCCAMPETA